MGTYTLHLGYDLSFRDLASVIPFTVTALYVPSHAGFQFGDMLESVISPAPLATTPIYALLNAFRRLALRQNALEESYTI